MGDLARHTSDAMTTDPWWDFSLHPETRSTPEANRLTDDEGLPLVNAPGPDGRLSLDYAGYLGLDRLLDAQRPASSVPDERAFVIVHQLCELVFKQMTFDLTVIAATFERLLALNEAERTPLALAEGEVDDPESEPAAFWRPAITASNRLRHAARRLLPPIMELMGTGREDDVLFSTVEFGHFRAHLEPSSGFQTAQLRLIQRALAKGPLLDLRLFPGDKYGHHYAGSPCGHVSLADPLVLREGAPRATPPDHHPAAQAAALDDLAHALLAALPHLGPALPPPPAVRRIHEADIERAVARFHATLGLASGTAADPATAREATERFGADLRRTADAENERRARLTAAREGGYYLQVRAPQSALAHILARLVALDDGLHTPGSESFLTVHRRTVRRHVADEGGTGGGGMPYLVTSQRYLLPLFPALVAYQDLEL